MLRAKRKRGLLLVWLVMFLLLAVPLYGQSILTQAVSGTGFIVSSDGYIITNRHVINGATNISVTIGSKKYEVRVVDSLSDNDIALLKVDAHGLPTVMLGDSSNVGIGDTVYAIGCPAGVCGTITQGRVANLGITSKTDEGTTLHNLIMSDLTTTHGSSGGPLLNDRGEVIGITTAGIVVQGETTGFGVSIPINQAIPLLREVPGFSTSQMGRATTVLTLDGIRRSVGPETAFVQAEIQRPLSDLLPKNALGSKLTIWTKLELGDASLDFRTRCYSRNKLGPGPFPSAVYSDNSFFCDLSRAVKDKGFSIADAAEASGYMKYGQQDRYMSVMVYQMQDSSVARAAQRYLNNEAPITDGILLNFNEKEKRLILQNSRSVGPGVLDLRMWAAAWVGLNNNDTGLMINTTYLGFATFTWGDILFTVVLQENDDDEVTDCSGVWDSFRWQISNGQIVAALTISEIISNRRCTHTFQARMTEDTFLQEMEELINATVSAANGL